MLRLEKPESTSTPKIREISMGFACIQDTNHLLSN